MDPEHPGLKPGGSGVAYASLSVIPLAAVRLPMLVVLFVEAARATDKAGGSAVRHPQKLLQRRQFYPRSPMRFAGGSLVLVDGLPVLCGDQFGLA
jgi:hypothetical protein